MAAGFLLALPVLALVLLAAHFVHAGLWIVAAACLALLALLGVRRPWSARVLQAALACGAVEWVLTAVMLARMRAAHDEPYLRMLLILGTVGVVTVLAALAFEHPVLRAKFGRARA